MKCPLKFNSKTIDESGYMIVGCFCEKTECMWYVDDTPTIYASGYCCIKDIKGTMDVLKTFVKLF